MAQKSVRPSSFPEAPESDVRAIDTSVTNRAKVLKSLQDEAMQRAEQMNDYLREEKRVA